MTLDCQGANRSMRPGLIVGGGFLLVLGVTMFLERTGIADVSLWRIIGPVCLIILGMLLLVEHGGLVYGWREEPSDGTRPSRARRRGAMTGGLWLVGVGCWMLVSQLELFGLDYHTSWPLLVVLSGIIMLVRGAR